MQMRLAGGNMGNREPSFRKWIKPAKKKRVVKGKGRWLNQSDCLKHKVEDLDKELDRFFAK